MSNSLKALCAFAFLVVVAACGQQSTADEFVTVDDGAVTTEPVFTGKYGN